jgi:ribose transport system permease protein
MTSINSAIRNATAKLPWLVDLAMLPLLLLLVLVFSLFNPSILSPTNIGNVLGQSSVVAIAAIGATFVILTAGIDLSAGSAISASGVAAAAAMLATGNIALGIVAGVATGLLAGAILGNIIARLGIAPFIVTLAGLFLISGTALLLTSGATIAPVPIELTLFTIANVGGIPLPVLVAAALFIVAQFVLTRTVWGRRVMLVGANPRAAEVSGINVRRVLISVYIVAGLFSGIAGVLVTAGLSGANASMGAPLLLNIIGAVVLGGTSLFGGRGSILRTAIGALLLGFLNNGMNLLGLASYDQLAVTGLVILVAASADAVLHRGSRR